MPRRGAKAPSADNGATGGSVTVVSGSIRTPDDPDELRVKLSIWDTEITMRVDGVELGNWGAPEIRIRAIDSSSFEFAAEGDQLIFTPDDPAAFVASSLVKGRISGGGRKKRRKAKKGEQAEPTPVEFDFAEPAPEPASRRRRRSAEKSDESRAARRERKAAERELAERAAAEESSSAVESASPKRESAVRPGPVPNPIGRAAGEVVADRATPDVKPTIRIPAFREPESEPTGRQELEVVEPLQQVEPEPVEVLEPAREKVSRQRKSLRRRGVQEELPPEVPAAEPTAEDPEEDVPALPNRLWIGALDLARKYDFLGLDRVPVNESLRGQEHQHTWDHRVAPTSGLGKYICTICGEIRR